MCRSRHRGRKDRAAKVAGKSRCSRRLCIAARSCSAEDRTRPPPQDAPRSPPAGPRESAATSARTPGRPAPPPPRRRAISKSGSMPASTGRSLRRSPQKAWIVPMRASSSSSSARSSRVALFGVGVRSRPLDLDAQPQLHLAGRFLGEGDRDDAGRACHGRLRISPTMRPTSAVVLPVPAAASTKKVAPNSVRIRRSRIRRQRGRSWQCPQRQ